MQQRLFAVILLLGLGIVALMSCTFIVDQRKAAIVFELGKIVRVVKQPGLHWKTPLIQKVRFFDTRLLTIDTVDGALYNTIDKQNVVVDSYIKWRISDVGQFYKNFSGDENLAVSRLQQSVNNALYAEFGKRTQNEVIASQREVLTQVVKQRVEQEMLRLGGITLVDVRLKRVDYPLQVSESVYQRMRAERTRVANELRSEGAARNIAIKADADRQRDTILAEAYRKAQEIKGAGDAQAASLYAAAFGKDPEFARFYRSMQAYRDSLKRPDDLLVLEPNHEFFRYFKQASPK